MRTTYIVIWIMVIREINNKNGGGVNEYWYLIYKNIYIFNPHKCQYTHILYTTYSVFINIIPVLLVYDADN